MPRQRSAGRSSRPPMRPPPPPMRRPPPPPPAPVQHHSSGGGGMGPGLASTMAHGMLFGTGSAVAHHAMDAAMLTPLAMQQQELVEAQPGSNFSPGQDVCVNQAKAFQDCLTVNLNDIGRCQFYVDMLNQCRIAPETASGWR